LPTGFAEQRVTEDLDNPTAMQFAPDGRLFVCQQGGALRVVKNGVLLSAPFVELEVDSDGERGLLGVAFHPEFATNGFVYVYHTVPGARPHNRVTRFTANGDGAVEGSGTVILDLETLSTATNHNGGAIHFGTDGMLYVAVGDNADGANSQTLTNRLGKLLRLRPDGGIPADNPFFNTAAGVNRAIWALGLRNPYTFDVERGTGRIFINDVGQNTWEEVNLGVAGANYGWPVVEGPSNDARFRAPLLAYRHGSGTSRGNAITGGAFYRPITPQFPDEYLGDFFFADFTNGWIRRRDSATGAISLFATGIDAPVDLKVGPDGALYYLSRGESAVYRVGYSAGGTLEALRLQPAQVRGGRKVRGTLVFSSPTTRAVTVRLTSSDRKRAKMRTQIRVGKGRRTFSFPISTRRVKKEKAILIRARLGAVTREATLTLSP
jgi:glucose/arabinose dehydrogenase